MNKERTLLRGEKAKYKGQLITLRNYIRELKGRCAECGTQTEHINHALMKAENDVQFYEGEIKSINKRIRELSAESAKSHS